MTTNSRTPGPAWPIALIFLAAALVTAAIRMPAATAQTVTPGLPVVPLGNCQMSSLGSSISPSACIRASFTATGSGTNLTTSSVVGAIKAGDTVTGTGVPAGTTIVSQTSGTTGGAGVYVTSAATTSSAASLTSGGIPPGTTMVVISVETAGIRWRDDGGAPTTTIGMPIAAAAAPYTYIGTASALRFIAQTGSPVISLAFYKSP